MRKSWNDANREKVTAWSKRYAEGLSDKDRAARDARVAEWHAAHPNEIREAAQRSRARRAHELHERRRRKMLENPERFRQMCRRRRARLHGLSGEAINESVAARIAVYGGRCAYCGWRAYSAMDHVIPVAKGGTNWPANLVPSCKTCNSRKHTKRPSEWAGFTGFHFP